MALSRRRLIQSDLISITAAVEFEFGVDGGKGFADEGELFVQFFHGPGAVGVDEGNLGAKGGAGVAFDAFNFADDPVVLLSVGGQVGFIIGLAGKAFLERFDDFNVQGLGRDLDVGFLEQGEEGDE